ncbi:hypothetical protein J7J18_06350 [bacterium]|nr:hypothetical protein [bacterium]
MKRLLFLIFIILGILALPLTGLAARTYSADGYTVEYEGLVPCGKCVKVSGLGIDTERGCNAEKNKYIHCQFCHFFVMLDAILDFIFQISIVIAALMLSFAGLLYIMSVMEFLPGGPQTLSQAKSIIGSVFLGLLIIFGAWVIINLFFQIIGVSHWTGLSGGWFEISCPIKL